MSGGLIMSIFDIFKKQNNQLKTENSCLTKNKDSEVKAEIFGLMKYGLVMEEDNQVKRLNPDACKIGGQPFLPVDFIWPTYTDKKDNVTRPLSFFCQLNFSELSPLDKEKQFPTQGMLSFFYECESSCWGFDPEDKGAARVFYFEDTTNFVEFDIPEDLNEDYVIPEIAVRFKIIKSYPMFEEFEVYSDKECKWKEYDDILEDLGVNTKEDFERHKVLGYADIIQGEMLSECERTSRGVYCGDPESYQNIPKDVAADITNKAKEWSLLLQLGTIVKDDFKWMFGDCGMLYYYIKKEDLAE